MQARTRTHTGARADTHTVLYWATAIVAFSLCSSQRTKHLLKVGSLSSARRTRCNTSCQPCSLRVAQGDSDRLVKEVGVSGCKGKIIEIQNCTDQWILRQSNNSGR